MTDTRFEVAVVGGGTAGLHAAAQLARTGRSVVLLERSEARSSGPTWMNGVVPWQFERAGLPHPATGFGPVEREGRFHIVSPDRSTIAAVAPSPVVHLDMRALTAYLRECAAEAGVHTRWRTRVTGVHFAATAPDSRLTHVVTSAGETIAANLFVDASGMAAVLRRSHPHAPNHWPMPRPDQVCRAYQYTYEVRRPEGARAFCRLWHAEPGDSVSFTGPSNGFSVTSVRVSADARHVDILVGTLEADSPLAASDLLRLALEDHPWIGRPLAGGGGRIPLAAPFDRLGALGLALLGDAANQVVAAHGSGIGLGLASASILAEQVGAWDDPGSTEAIEAYERAFLREFGALTAGYERFRRHSSELGPSGIQRLFESGLFDGEMAAIGLAQRVGSIPLRQVPRRLAAAAAHPRVAIRLAPTLVRMQLVRPLFALRPNRSRRSHAAWQRLANGRPRAESL